MKKSFTLIELLVVIAIIGLLVIIIAIPINRVRRGASITRILQYEASLHRYLGADIVGWWQFNEGEGTTAKDTTRNNNHGTLINNPQWVDGVPGKGGSALEFEGGRIHTGITTTPPNMTFSVWFRKTTSNWGSIAILGKRNSTTGWMLYRNSNDTEGYFRWYMHYRKNDNSIASYRAWPGISDLQTDIWYNIVVTRTVDGYSNIYKNGILVSESTPPNDFSDWVYNSNAIAIGAEREGSNSWNNTGSIMDDIRIYSRILSSEEINTLYTEAKNKYITEEL